MGRGKESSPGDSDIHLSLGINYKLVLAKGTCHLPLWELKPVLLQLCDLRHVLKGAGGSGVWGTGMRQSVLWENWQNRSSDSYFQELIL